MKEKQEAIAKPKKEAKFYDNILNKNIRGLLNERKMKTEELAEALSVSSEAVRLWCSGYARPDIDKLLLISKHFDVSTDYLLGRTDIQNPEIDDMAINKKLGLSGEAIIELKAMQRTIEEHDRQEDIPGFYHHSIAALKCINLLIEKENRYQIIWKIHHFLSSKYVRPNISYPAYATDYFKGLLDNNVDVLNEITGEREFISYELLDMIHLPLIQNGLIELKKNINDKGNSKTKQ